MRTRTGTEGPFICFILWVETAGRRKIRLLIYKVWIPDKVEILLDTPAPLNIPVLIPEKFGMDLAVSLSVYR